MIPCSCGGENENCFKCDGRGWYEPGSLEPKQERGKLPPIRAELSSFHPTSYGPAREPLPEPPPPLRLRQILPIAATIKPIESKRSKGKHQAAPNQPRPTKKTKNDKITPPASPKAHKRFVIKPFSVTRFERRILSAKQALEQGWIGPESLSECSRYQVKIKVTKREDLIETSLLSIKPVPRKPRGIKPVQHAKPTKAKVPKVSIGQREARNGNPAMREALEREVLRSGDDRSPKWLQMKEIPERRLDASKDYWPIRDHGSFGSYPSHDDFDE